MQAEIWRENFIVEYREGEDEYYDSGTCKLNWAETVFIGRLWC